VKVCIDLPLQFAIVKWLTLWLKEGHGQATGRIEFAEKLLFPLGDLLLKGRDVDQVVAFMWIGRQIVEAVFVPDPVVVDVFVAVAANGQSGGSASNERPSIFPAASAGRPQ
jgi:hypothetical protein